MLADSVPLVITTDEPALNETLGAGAEAAHIDWQMFRPKYGNSVEISSGVTSPLGQSHLHLANSAFLTEFGYTEGAWERGLAGCLHSMQEYAKQARHHGSNRVLVASGCRRTLDTYDQHRMTETGLNALQRC